MALPTLTASESSSLPRRGVLATNDRWRGVVTSRKDRCAAADSLNAASVSSSAPMTGMGRGAVTTRDVSAEGECVTEITWEYMNMTIDGSKRDRLNVYVHVQCISCTHG